LPDPGRAATTSVETVIDAPPSGRGHSSWRDNDSTIAKGFATTLMPLPRRSGLHSCGMANAPTLSGEPQSAMLANGRRPPKVCLNRESNSISASRGTAPGVFFQATTRSEDPSSCQTYRPPQWPSGLPDPKSMYSRRRIPSRSPFLSHGQASPPQPQAQAS
jgi:hypothetical protein